MTTFTKESQIEFWDRDWRTIGPGHYIEQLTDVKNQWQLYEVVKFRFLENLFSSVGAGHSMLECGCGSAGVSLYFARRGYHCTMLDFTSSALAVAETNFSSHASSGSFVQADVSSLPLDSDSYDIVTSFGLLEHFTDPGPVIREMVRVLKPGGLFFADIVPHRFSVQTLANYGFNLWAVLVYTLISRKWKYGSTKLKFVLGRPEYYENSFSIERYAAELRQAGLTQVATHGNNPFPRLYLPGSLDQFYMRLMIYLMPLWLRFNNAHNWLTDVWWARAWWAVAVKPPSLPDKG